jgi:hypothetical protein
MAITIELSPETESAVRARAEATGEDAAQLLRNVVEAAFPAQPVETPSIGDERPTIAEMYPGRFGRIEGSSEPYSENTGRRFTEYVEQKYREGRL